MSTANTKSSAGIYLADDEREALIEIARTFGCVSTRGRAPGEPSIRVLLGDIAAGRLVVRRLAGRPKARQESASAQIRAALDLDPDASPTDLAERFGCTVGLASRLKQAHRAKMP